MIWWHQLRNHYMIVKRISVPSFDPGAKGLLIMCSCGKVWAK